MCNSGYAQDDVTNLKNLTNEIHVFKDGDRGFGCQMTKIALEYMPP